MMITVFGSINVDLTFRLPHLPAVGETVLTPAVSQAVGGKGANQAVMAARLGARVSFVGCVGDDALGAETVGNLTAKGVGHYGIFSGRKFRELIYPQIRSFIRLVAQRKEDLNLVRVK